MKSLPVTLAVGGSGEVGGSTRLLMKVHHGNHIGLGRQERAYVAFKHVAASRVKHMTKHASGGCRRNSWCLPWPRTGARGGAGRALAAEPGWLCVKSKECTGTLVREGWTGPKKQICLASEFLV